MRLPCDYLAAEPVNQINVNVVVGHPWSWNKGQDPTYVADAFVYTHTP